MNVFGKSVCTPCEKRSALLFYALISEIKCDEQECTYRRFDSLALIHQGCVRTTCDRETKREQIPPTVLIHHSHV